MEGICRYENRVMQLVARCNRWVSTPPVIVPLQGRVVGADGCDGLGAAVDMGLQLVALVSSVGCRVEQAKVNLHGH